MDTTTLRRDLDAYHNGARTDTSIAAFHPYPDCFTPMMIFACEHDFPVFAAEHGVAFKRALGCYEGVIEEVFVVAGAEGPLIYDHQMLDRQKTVLLLAAQEMCRDGKRAAYLVQPVALSGLAVNPVYIGQWCEVKAREALLSPAWTCYPEDNLWYVARLPSGDLDD